MERLLVKELEAWKSRKGRKPLLLKGVRQCGKTYLLREFGKAHFSDVAYFNFELTPALSDLFETDLDPSRIITELGILRGKKIETETTLIIWDEVQFCPKALTALKYFSELAPGYALACAGSLLGVALSKPSSFPVGKVDILVLRPMDFREFLVASQEEQLIDYAAGLPPDGQLSQALIDKFLVALRMFQIIGGMPEAVAEWLQNRNLAEVERIQDAILASYELDFAKYAPPADFPKLKLIWKSIPAQLSRESGKFLYGHAKPGARAKDLEDALGWLTEAGLVYKVGRVEKPAFPLSAYMDQKAFKLYLADIGLLRRLAGVPGSVMLDGNTLYSGFKGALTENFVLNELLRFLGDLPSYWTSGNQAEVDFVFQYHDSILPLEVKAATNIRSRSLAAYREKYRPQLALRTSLMACKSKNGLLNIPLYLLWNMDVYVRKVLS
jgi:uncharacterized protein